MVEHVGGGAVVDQQFERAGSRHVDWFEHDRGHPAPQRRAAVAGFPIDADFEQRRSAIARTVVDTERGVERLIGRGDVEDQRLPTVDPQPQRVVDTPQAEWLAQAVAVAVPGPVDREIGVELCGLWFDAGEPAGPASQEVQSAQRGDGDGERTPEECLAGERFTLLPVAVGGDKPAAIDEGDQCAGPLERGEVGEFGVEADGADRGLRHPLLRVARAEQERLGGESREIARLGIAVGEQELIGFTGSGEQSPEFPTGGRVGGGGEDEGAERLEGDGEFGK